MKNLPLKNESFNYVEQSFKEWLIILGYAPSTVYQLPNYIHEFFHHLEQKGVQQITDIAPKHFKEHYQLLKQRSNQRRGGGLSNNYLNKHLQGLYKFADYLRQSGRLQLGSLNIDWEREDKEAINYLSQEEIQILFAATYKDERRNHLNVRDRALLCIFYGCGLRRNEGVHLDLSDVNYDRKIIHVRKGKNYKERFVPFNKSTSQYLQEWVYDARPLLCSDATDNAFFISQKNRRMDGQSMAIRMKLLQQKTEDINLQSKNIRLHVLRHSIATHLLQNGMTLEKIGRFLGHSSLESTQVYTHLAKEDEQY